MRNTKLRAALTIALLLCGVTGSLDHPALAQTTVSWTPPIGIPAPNFGITDSHHMYQLGAGETCLTQPGKCYDFGLGLEPYKNAGSGPYTHYVDPSSPICVNTANNYGTHLLPRCAMPSMTTVRPGAVIEIHGSITSAMVSRLELTAAGTAAAPVFIRGASPDEKGSFNNVVFRVRGSYVIFENLEFLALGPDIRPASTSEVVHHVTLRHSYLHAKATTSLAGLNGSTVQNVVIYDNQIHSDQFDPSGGEFIENDRHGVGIGSYSENVWIVDNDIRGQTGDAVGNGHAAAYTTKRFFIGRNQLHDTGENGVDLKEVQDFVISQNKIFNFTGLSSGSDGTAVVIHYGPTYSPKNTWFIFNEIYNASHKGIQIGGTQVPEAYFVGNVVHDIHNATGTGRALDTWGSCKINIIGNTFANNDNGITATGTAACGKLVFKNNIVVNRTTAGYTIDRLTDSGYAAAADVSHNVLFPVAAASGVVCSNCLVANPLFVDTATGNYRLQLASPAIDAAERAITDALASQFSASFGQDIRKDADGKNRPGGASDDVGAFESDGTEGERRPPSGLRII